MSRKLSALRLPAPGTNVAHQLLADFICSPVSMRADRFGATVEKLHGLTQGRGGESLASQMQALTAQLGDMGEDECMPWEEPIYEIEAGVAIVKITGPLVKGYDEFTCWYYGMMSIDALQEALRELTVDANVRAVVLELNTPGGMSTGMAEVADLIRALDALKPVFAFTSDMAASNGYRIAAACRAILTTRSAVLGCISTYIALYDRSEYLAQLGIKLELFRDGSLKGIGVLGKTLTDAERKFLQGSVERSGAVFKDLVRQMRADVKEETMQGQWFDGEEAITLGLADLVVTDLATVCADIRAELGIPSA